MATIVKVKRPEWKRDGFASREDWRECKEQSADYQHGDKWYRMEIERHGSGEAWMRVKLEHERQNIAALAELRIRDRFFPRNSRGRNTFSPVLLGQAILDESPDGYRWSTDEAPCRKRIAELLGRQWQTRYANATIRWLKDGYYLGRGG